MSRIVRTVLLALIACFALPAIASAAPAVTSVTQQPAGTLHVSGTGFAAAKVLTVRTSGGTFRIYSPTGTRSADNPAEDAIVWSSTSIDVTADPRLPGRQIFSANVDGSQVNANPAFYMQTAGLAISAPGADGTIEITAFSGLSGLPYLILHTDAGDLVFANPRGAQGGHAGVLSWTDQLIRISTADLNGATISTAVLSTAKNDGGSVQAIGGVIVPPLPAPAALIASAAISRAFPTGSMHIHVEGSNLLQAGLININAGGSHPTLYNPANGRYDQSQNKVWTDTMIDADVTEGYYNLSCSTTVGDVSAYGLDFVGVVSAYTIGAQPSCPYAKIAATSASLGGTNCQITVAGAVYCQGADYYGQLGQGNTVEADSSTPLLVGGALAGKTVTQISAGIGVICALDTTSHLYCWGGDSGGGIGDGTVGAFRPPTDISGQGSLAGKTVAKVSSGGNQACALTTDGTISCWGRGDQGALGNGGTAAATVPTPVIGGAIWRDLSVGSNHVCAITSATSQLYCWGAGGNGRLGNGDETNRTSPTLVSGGALAGKAMSQVAAGAFHTCALDTAGKAYCWGTNSYGATGFPGANGNSNPLPLATTMPAGVSFTMIAAGDATSCAISATGQLYCWGQDYGDYYGGGSTPALITGGDMATLGSTGIHGLSVGAGACVVNSQSYSFCWGPNYFGELGNGTSNQSRYPSYTRVPAV